MMRDPFDYSFDLLDDDLIRESADAKGSRKSWYLTLAFVLLAALVCLLAIRHWTVQEAQRDLGGEEGVLQNGAYYIYAGSGFSLPNEVRVPRGIFAYTPGQEPELLVSTEDYAMDVLFHSWDVNSHSLYFVDENTVSLYRMDLETREVTALYAMPAPMDPEEVAKDMTWDEVKSGAYREAMEEAASYSPYLLLHDLDEEQVILVCSDGTEDTYLTLDSRTGEVLAQQADAPPALTVPPGEALAAEARRLGLPEETETVNEDGREVRYSSLTLTDAWLFYTKTWPNEDPAITVWPRQLWAMDRDTGERYLVQEETDLYQVVTDGTWLYRCGDATDCYRLDYTPEGIPCGLTLIEEGI